MTKYTVVERVEEIRTYIVEADSEKAAKSQVTNRYMRPEDADDTEEVSRVVSDATIWNGGR